MQEIELSRMRNATALMAWFVAYAQLENLRVSHPDNSEELRTAVFNFTEMASFMLNHSYVDGEAEALILPGTLKLAKIMARHHADLFEACAGSQIRRLLDLHAAKVGRE